MNRRSGYRLVEVDYDKMHCVLHSELKWNDQVLAIWSASIWTKILSNAGFTKAVFPESTNIPFEPLLHWHAQFIVHGRCYYKMDDVGWYSIWSAPVNKVLYTTTFSMTVTHSSPENTSLQLASGDGIFDLCYSVSAVHYLASASLTKTAEQRIGQLTSSLQRVLGPNARPCTLQAYLILVPIGRY